MKLSEHHPPLPFGVLGVALALIGLGLSPTSQASRSSKIFARGVRYYNSGNCQKAVRFFSRIANSSRASAHLRYDSLFRLGYCHYQMGNLSDGEEAFQKFLKKYPKNEEARARYSELLLYQGDAQGAIDAADALDSKDYKVTKSLVQAQAHLSLGEAQKAHRKLASLGPALRGYKNYRPEIEYWRGVAAYHRGEHGYATSSFEAAIRHSSDELWIKGASQEWLERIKYPGKTAPFSLYIGGGAFYDGNVDQLSNLSLSEDSTTGEITESDNSSDPATDSGTLLFGGVKATPWDQGKFRIITSFDFSGSIYGKQKDYGFSSLTGGIQPTYAQSSSLEYFTQINYVDTRYNYNYYQDYIHINPGANWFVDPKTFAKFTFGIAKEIKTDDDIVLSLGASYNWQKDWGNFWLGLSVARTSGDKASIESGSLIDGELFSRYTTLNPNLGAEVPIFWGFYLSGNLSLVATSFEEEDTGTTTTELTTEFQGPRKDRAYTGSIGLSRSLFWGIRMDATGSYTVNTSTGFQGLADDDGTVTHRGYKRAYFSLSFNYSL